MDVYELEEKIKIIEWHHRGNPVRGIRELFINLFPNRPTPTISTIHRVIKNFLTFFPRKHKHDSAPEENNEREMKEIMVVASVIENPTISINTIAEQVDLSRRSVGRVLKKNGYRSYKVRKTHEIFPDDHFRRMQFCETVMEMENNNENFIRNIVFTDESTFPLHGRHNPAITRYWSKENLHRFFELRTQYPQKLNIWGGMLGENMIGPFVIDGALTGPKYLELLQLRIVPEIRRLAGPRFADIWFQHDGCPAHNSVLVQEYLNNTFTNRLMTGRGTILWPARSPDLSPNDFFLWGHVKSQIYGFQENRANNLQELQLQIENSFRNITPNILANVRRRFYDNLGYCLAQEGGLFEHLR